MEAQTHAEYEFKQDGRDAIGALALTRVLVVLHGCYVCPGYPLQSAWHLIARGKTICEVGLSGDLVGSSIKHNLGVKGIGIATPGSATPGIATPGDGGPRI